VAFRKSAKIELLRRTPLFSECSKRELGEIAAIADEVDIPTGRAFIREGHQGREFFALIEGTVEVHRNGRKVKVKGGSDFFGEISLISATPRTATVTATSPVRALVITGPAFGALMRRVPQLQLKVLRSLAERLAPDESV
jgi:CRP/FNR family cyclic AMP-dependent transcriptional regulator